MNPYCKFLAITLLMTLLSSCSHQAIDDYAQNLPTMALPEFFVGTLDAHGVVKNRSGKVTRYFTAQIQARWDQGIGTLEEEFLFNDGEVQQRTWTLKPNQTGYSATAGDVLGSGQALIQGNAMRLDYTLNIDYRGSKLALQVEDWMWRIDSTTLLNESTLRKWGFKVGSIQLVIRKKSLPVGSTSVPPPKA